jgi:hypothetical protein
MELSWAERPLDARPLDSFPAFHGTRRFNTEFTRALHLFLSCARPIQSTSPHPTSPRSILILSTYLRFGLPSGLFPSGSPTNNLYAFLCSLIRATWPAHLILLDLIVLIILGEEYKSRSSSLCNFHSTETNCFGDLSSTVIFQSISDFCSTLSSVCRKAKQAPCLVFMSPSFLCNLPRTNSAWTSNTTVLFASHCSFVCCQQFTDQFLLWRSTTFKWRHRISLFLCQ